MSVITVNGIIISSMPIGEYDRRVEILTGPLGKISAFASGARKPSSRLISSSRLFALGAFELYRGKSAYNLRNARIIDFFTELEKDMETACVGSYFLEVCRYFARENVEASAMLELLYASLKALERKERSAGLIRAVFELKMLEINGICPSGDDICAKQGRFSAGEDLREGTALAVKYVISSAPAKVFSFKFDKVCEAQFIDASNRLWKLLIDKKFKSLELLT